MTIEQAKDYYRAFIKTCADIYEQNSAFLEKHLFTTLKGGPNTVPFYTDKDPAKNEKINPDALKLWKQIYLDDGTTKPGQREKNLGECVSLVSNLTSITPDIAKWRGGARVVDSDNIKPGTAIATFNDQGIYDPKDRPHAAIFISKGTDRNGKDYILLLEQFNPGHKGRHPQIRALYPKPEPTDPKQRDYSNAANYFRIIETQ